MAENVLVHEIPALMPYQRELFRWDPEPGVRYFEAGCLSPAWAVGKTHAVAGRVARYLMEQSFPGSNFICTAPTNKTLRKSMPAHLERFLPSDFIRSRRKPDNYLEWELITGGTVLFWPFGAYVDSIDANGIWVDEVQDQACLDEYKWGQVMARLRGDYPQLALFFSGVGILHDTFTARFKKPNGPDYFVTLPGLKHAFETKRDPTFIERQLSRYSAENRDAALNGGWVQPPTGAWPHLILDPDTEDTNVYRDDTDPWFTGEREVWLSIDPGEQAGGVIVAPIEVEAPPESDRRGLVALRSYYRRRMDADDFVRDILNDPEADWRITRCFVDTDSVREVRKVVASVLPKGVIIEDLKKGGRAWKLQVKLDKFSTAICDANGVRRFLVAEEMLHEPKRHLVDQLRTATLKPDGKLNKPDREHTRDAAIYAVCCGLRQRSERKKFKPKARHVR